MKTLEKIKAIKTATLAEFAKDAAKEIIETEVKEGCVMELDGAPVFEELASARGESVRSLGNGHNWELTGLQAAELLTIERCLEADDEYEVVADLVEKA